jgi:predicted HicB family RNase H-like nuclease
MEREELGGHVQLPYKPEDYAYSVMWSEEDQAYVGRVAEFASLAAHGASPALALREMTEVVGCVLEDLVESGELVPPPFSKRPFSGKLHLRMPEYLHRHLALEAAQQGVSLNQWINLKLSLPVSK